jgi:uncharacterized protein (TIRG00374 family)
MGVAFFILTFLVLSIGIDALLETIKTVKPSVGLLTGGCLIALFFLGAFNVWIILRAMHPIPFAAFLTIYSYSWALSLITPGQAGDASLILFLKKYGIPYHRTGVAYMLDKSITVGVFFCIAWLGSYFFLEILKGMWLPFFTLFFFILICGLSIIRYFPSGNRVTRKIRDWLDNFKAELYRFKRKWYILFFNSQVTILKWLVLSICYFTAFLAFNAHVKWPEIGVIPILTSLVGYIPVSISGIGTVEYSAAYLFSKIGIQQSIVLSVYLFLRILQYALAFILLMFLKSVRKNTR